MELTLTGLIVEIVLLLTVGITLMALISAWARTQIKLLNEILDLIKKKRD